MDKLYIIIPAYNEEATIGTVINDWYPIVEKYIGGGKSRLVIINDGSKDDTYKIILEYAKNRPLLIPLDKENGGHGAAVLYGYNYALEHSADYIFQTDSDGQTLPEEFHQFWEIRQNYDMVIGWRKRRKDGLSRIFVTKVLKFVLKLCFGVDIADANTPFRIMNAECLTKYIKYIPENFNLSNILLSVIYTKQKCSVKFIPITFRPRQGGVNSINLKKIFKIGKKAVADFRKINENLKNIE